MPDQPTHVVIDGLTILTPRLRLRPWNAGDATAALAIYGEPAVSRWLTPAMEPLSSADGMRILLQRWISEAEGLELPQGRWAIELVDSSVLVGGAALLALPPWRSDIEIGWQLAPAQWGRGIAAEAGHALAHYAFQTGAVDELFAVARPRNDRGIATARRVGMDWVGMTDKYYDLNLEVYRIRKGDLAATEAAAGPAAGPDEAIYRKNDETHAYEALADGQIVGSLEYRQRGTRLVFTHTTVSPNYRGRGIASALIRLALDDLRTERLTLTNYCPFVRDFLVANPKYMDLLDAAHPGIGI